MEPILQIKTYREFQTPSYYGASLGTVEGLSLRHRDSVCVCGLCASPGGGAHFVVVGGRQRQDLSWQLRLATTAFGWGCGDFSSLSERKHSINLSPVVKVLGVGGELRWHKVGLLSVADSRTLFIAPVRIRRQPGSGHTRDGRPPHVTGLPGACEGSRGGAAGAE